MCYPKPGPRCSTRASQELMKAQALLQEARDSESDAQTITKLEANLKVKRTLYAITPAGRQALEQDIRENGDPEGVKRRSLKRREARWHELIALSKEQPNKPRKANKDDDEYIGQGTLFDLTPAQAKISRPAVAVEPKSESKPKAANDTPLLEYKQNQKTSIRELSVVAGIHGIDSDRFTNLSGHAFIDTISGITSLTGEKDLNTILAWGSWNKGGMPHDLVKLANNGIFLGNAIREAFYQNRDVTRLGIVWSGIDKTDKKLAPRDLIISGDLWSLKDNSDILKNGSAKDLFNTSFGTNTYSAKVHSLRDFNPKAFDKQYEILAKAYNAKYPNHPIPGNYEEWSEPAYYTAKGMDTKRRGRYRKDAANKFISLPEYAGVKNAINELAGEEYMKRLPKDHSKIAVGNLIGYDTSYYYGSISGQQKTLIGFVPDGKTITEKTKVTDIKYTSGRQLDIFMTLENKYKENFVLQYEMRYSHGQLIGYPEAKLKKAAGGNLVHFLR